MEVLLKKLLGENLWEKIIEKLIETFWVILLRTIEKNYERSLVRIMNQKDLRELLIPFLMQLLIKLPKELPHGMNSVRDFFFWIWTFGIKPRFFDNFDSSSLITFKKSAQNSIWDVIMNYTKLKKVLLIKISEENLDGNCKEILMDFYKIFFLCQKSLFFLFFHIMPLKTVWKYSWKSSGERMKFCRICKHSMKCKIFLFLRILAKGCFIS